jgi:hypothetical protein
MAIFLFERELEGTQLVCRAAIQPHVFTERIEDKVALGDR